MHDSEHSARVSQVGANCLGKGRLLTRETASLIKADNRIAIVA